MRSQHGQAMTELVIALPLFILLLLGLHQFSVLLVRRLELAQVEREAMRYLTADGEDAARLQDFARECGGRYGMDPEKLTVVKGEGGGGEMKSSEFGALFEKLTGVTVTLSYEQELAPAFRAMTGRQSVTLKTTIASAAGGCLKMAIDRNKIEADGQDE